MRDACAVRLDHAALDHPWVRRRPDRYVRAAPELAAAEPGSWFAIRCRETSARLFTRWTRWFVGQPTDEPPRIVHAGPAPPTTTI